MDESLPPTWRCTSSIGRDICVNIMPQYHPMHRARHYPEINRGVTRQEFAQAVQWARDAGLTNLQSQ
jgi:putative pyruvate formate lyase activating enzyme